MKYLKGEILSDNKQQFSNVAKGKGCSKFLIDSLEDQITRCKMKYMKEELKKN